VLIVVEERERLDSLDGGRGRIEESHMRVVRACMRQILTGKDVSKVDGCGGSCDGVHVPWLFWFPGKYRKDVTAN